MNQIINYNELAGFAVMVKPGDEAKFVVSAKQASELLQVSLSTFHTHLSRGYYPFTIIKIHTHNFYFISELIDFIRNKRGKGRPKIIK